MKTESKLSRLLAARVITEAQARLISQMQVHLARHAGEDRPAEDLAVAYGFCTEAAAHEALTAQDAEESHLRPVELPPYLLRQLEVLPLGVAREVLQVSALSPLSDAEKRQLLEACAGAGVAAFEVEEVPLDAGKVLDFLQELASDAQTLARALDRFNQDPEGGAVADVLRGILNEAVQEQASDVHVVRDANILNCTVSYRIDGKLQVRYLLTPASSRVLTTRVKNDAGMDYSKTREPQDGRIGWQAPRRSIDIRVASLPSSGGGEKLVLRLLDPANRRPLAVQLRDHPEVLKRALRYTRISSKTPGLVLVTGPTGSGKSSFLYGLITEMDRLGLSIDTAEDPVELQVSLVTQTSVATAIGMGFSETLRAQMRADPDILGVGEVRDRATAESVLRSAESGHFVLTTLHSSSSEESVQRLLNLLPPEYRSVGELSVANYLQAVLNLRLVSRVCSCAHKVCASDAPGFDAALSRRLSMAGTETIPVAKGCPRCHGTGYQGRVMVPEALFIPGEPATRKSVLKALRNLESEGLTDVPGVEHFSRESAVRNLLVGGQIDLSTALLALGEFQ